MAELSRRDKANRQQKLGLVWRNRKKISQSIKDYFYLPFFLLIILWPEPIHPDPTALYGCTCGLKAQNFESGGANFMRGNLHRILDMQHVWVGGFLSQPILHPPLIFLSKEILTHR
jgi:hypothetical protein